MTLTVLLFLTLSPAARCEIDVNALSTQTPMRLGTDQVGCLAFSPDGKLLVASYHTDPSTDPWVMQTVLLWDPQTQEQVGVINMGKVGSIDFGPDGSLMALGTSDNLIRLWNVDEQRLVKVVGAPSQYGASARFSPNGSMLAFWGNGGASVVKLWDSRLQAQIGTLNYGSGGGKLAFSPDSRFIVTGGSRQDKTIRVWDSSTRVQIGTLVGHMDATYDLAFSPDGSLLASAGGWDDKAVYLWDIEELQQVGILGGHSAHVGSVEFSIDGTLLATTAYWDDFVYLWDAQTHTQVGVLGGHDASDIGWNDKATFSPDGKWLAVGGDNGVELWGPLPTRSQSNQTTLIIQGTLTKVGLNQYLRLEWPSEVGSQYTIQLKTDLAESGWTNLIQLPGSGELLTEDLLIDQPEGLYRVLATSGGNTP